MKLEELVIDNVYKIHPPNHAVILVKYVGIEESEYEFVFTETKKLRLAFICLTSKEKWYHLMTNDIAVEELSSLEVELW